MITLFSEEVKTTSTNSVHNTLYVKSFSEAFFGVYEFEINGSPVIAEQVGTFDNYPVISVSIVEADGNKKEMEFILKKGEQKVELGSVTKVITEKVEEVVPAPSLNVFYVDNFEEIHFDVYEFELNGQKLVAEKVDTKDGHPVVEVPIGNGTARVVLERVKVKATGVIEEKAIAKADVVSKERQIRSELNAVKTDSNAAIKVIEEKLESAVDSVDRQKTELFIEFTRMSDNLKRATKEDFAKFVEEANEQNKSNSSDLKEFVTEQLFNEYGNFLKRVKDTQEELKKRRKENKLIAANILALEKSQVDLNNTNDSIKKQITEATSASEKNVNKALSRLGVVKKELETSKDNFDIIKEDLAASIEKAEERVKLYYHEKIRMVEESVFKNIRREEILDTIKKSKSMILAELNNTNGLKDQLRQLATEAAKGEYDPITGKRFQEQLKRDLNKQFADEMMNIRRMIELGAGGGTNAVQYANGGTMNGNLNVNGVILSGGQDLIDIIEEHGGKYDSNLASNIAMTEDVGGLDSGTTVASLTGQSFSQLFDSLLFPTVDPVVGSNNSTGLSDNVSNLQTIGATINITLTTTAGLGTIRLNGVTQGDYAGGVTAASISGPGGPYTLGVGPGGTDIDNQTVSNHVVTEGSNSWSMTTTYGEGPMPLDSAGNDFPGIRFAAGGTRSASTSFEGVYPIRLGLGTGSSNFEDRALTSHSSNNIQVSQDYTETDSLRHRIAIPNDMIDSQTVGWQQWNTVSSSYSDIAASSFTSSSITVTIEGNTVNYTLYTKTGPPGGGDVSGQPIYRITFS